MKITGSRVALVSSCLAMFFAATALAQDAGALKQLQKEGAASGHEQPQVPAATGKAVKGGDGKPYRIGIEELDRKFKEGFKDLDAKKLGGTWTHVLHGNKDSSGAACYKPGGCDESELEFPQDSNKVPTSFGAGIPSGQRALNSTDCFVSGKYWRPADLPFKDGYVFPFKIEDNTARMKTTLVGAGKVAGLSVECRLMDEDNLLCRFTSAVDKLEYVSYEGFTRKSKIAGESPTKEELIGSVLGYHEFRIPIEEVKKKFKEGFKDVDAKKLTGAWVHALHGDAESTDGASYKLTSYSEGILKFPSATPTPFGAEASELSGNYWTFKPLENDGSLPFEIKDNTVHMQKTMKAELPNKTHTYRIVSFQCRLMDDDHLLCEVTVQEADHKITEASYEGFTRRK